LRAERQVAQAAFDARRSEIAQIEKERTDRNGLRSDIEFSASGPGALLNQDNSVNSVSNPASPGQKSADFGVLADNKNGSSKYR